MENSLSNANCSGLVYFVSKAGMVRLFSATLVILRENPVKTRENKCHTQIVNFKPAFVEEKTLYIHLSLRPLFK